MTKNRKRTIRRQIAIYKERIAYFREQIDILLKADPVIQKMGFVNEEIKQYYLGIRVCNDEINKLYISLVVEAMG